MLAFMRICCDPLGLQRAGHTCKVRGRVNLWKGGISTTLIVVMRVRGVDHEVLGAEWWGESHVVRLPSCVRAA